MAEISALHFGPVYGEQGLACLHNESTILASTLELFGHRKARRLAMKAWSRTGPRRSRKPALRGGCAGRGRAHNFQPSLRLRYPQGSLTRRGRARKKMPGVDNISMRTRSRRPSRHGHVAPASPSSDSVTNKACTVVGNFTGSAERPHVTSPVPLPRRHPMGNLARAL